MVPPDFVDLNKMVSAMPVALPPLCPGLKFLNPSPFFGLRRAEALQKNLHLEIFWGFGTRTAPAGGRQYLTGGGGHRVGRRWRAARLWLIRQGGGSAQGVPRDGSRAARRRRKGVGR